MKQRFFKRAFTSSLTRRAAFLVFFGGVIPYCCTSGIAMWYVKNTLETNMNNRLSGIRTIVGNQIVHYLENRLADAKILAGSGEVKEVIDILKTYEDLRLYTHREMSKEEETDDPYKKARIEIQNTIDPFYRDYFKEYVSAFGYMDIYFLSRKKGQVMYQAIRSQNEKMQKEDFLLPGVQATLKSLWKKVKEKNRPLLTDFIFTDKKNQISAFLGAPVTGPDKKLSAVMVLEIGPGHLNRLMQGETRIGKTGETYLVGQNKRLLFSSRVQSSAVSEHKTIHSEIAALAFAGETDTRITENYEGNTVHASFSKLGLPKKLGVSFDWALITGIHRSEALQPVKVIFYLYLILGALSLILMSIILYVARQSIIVPLKFIINRIVQMASGNLTVDSSPTKREDEIGVLINAFHEMLVITRNQTQKIMEGTNTIASSISQISATATELATSSSQTSSSVNEITKTVEEIRETAEVSRQKAKHVAKSAEEAADISESGKKATEDVLSGMNRIKEEMSYVAESIIKLSDQTQSIGEIINAVNDLADQSNLLSVNAAIEAAKAGEHGKGFAVVAQEVKSLADQSKSATNQVRTILNDIQKATSAAVLATERGNKAVEAGVSLSNQTSRSITALSDSVMESENAATQIAASSQEQFIGMDQLAQAMESIKDASIQNVDAARQLENATKDLDSLGQSLKELCDSYKV